MTDFPNHDNRDDWAHDHAGSFSPCKRTLEMAAQVAENAAGEVYPTSPQPAGWILAGVYIATVIRKLGEQP